MDMITVVVPAYNSERTISRCINSILKQTYQDIQLIVVDDGSEDGTRTIVEEFQKHDSRIELISICNSGVSHARNVGIDSAKGEYITFVDSDDYIDEVMYESLIKIINEYDADIAHCSYKNVNEDGMVINLVGNSGSTIFQTHDEAIEYILTDKVFNESLCNKLYAHHLFDNIRLDDSIKINEDVLANFCLFDVARNSVYLDAPYYSYVSNLQSATHTKKGFAGEEQSLIVANRILEMSKNKPYELYAKRRVAQRCLNLYKSYVYSDSPEIRQKKKELKNILKGYKSEFVRRIDKIAYVLLLYFPLGYKTIYKFYSKKRVKQLDPFQ